MNMLSVINQTLCTHFSGRRVLTMVMTLLANSGKQSGRHGSGAVAVTLHLTYNH